VVAGFYMPNARSHFFDDSSPFISEDHGHWISGPASIYDVQTTVTYAGGDHAYHDFVFFRSLQVQVGYFQWPARLIE
jgi:hypothetical protein